MKRGKREEEEKEKCRKEKERYWSTELEVVVSLMRVVRDKLYALKQDKDIEYMLGVELSEAYSHQHSTRWHVSECLRLLREKKAEEIKK